MYRHGPATNAVRSAQSAWRTPLYSLRGLFATEEKVAFFAQMAVPALGADKPGCVCEPAPQAPELALGDTSNYFAHTQGMGGGLRKDHDCSGGQVGDRRLVSTARLTWPSHTDTASWYNSQPAR